MRLKADFAFIAGCEPTTPLPAGADQLEWTPTTVHPRGSSPPSAPVEPIRAVRCATGDRNRQPASRATRSLPTVRASPSVVTRSPSSPVPTPPTPSPLETPISAQITGQPRRVHRTIILAGGTGRAGSASTDSRGISCRVFGVCCCRYHRLPLWPDSVMLMTTSITARQMVDNNIAPPDRVSARTCHAW